MLITISLLGSIMYSVENVATLYHGALGLVGALIGFFLMYMIKGVNTCAIINVSKEFVN